MKIFRYLASILPNPLTMLVLAVFAVVSSLILAIITSLGQPEYLDAMFRSFMGALAVFLFGIAIPYFGFVVAGDVDKRRNKTWLSCIVALIFLIPSILVLVMIMSMLGLPFDE